MSTTNRSSSSKTRVAWRGYELDGQQALTLGRLLIGAARADQLAGDEPPPASSLLGHVEGYLDGEMVSVAISTAWAAARVEVQYLGRPLDGTPRPPRPRPELLLASAIPADVRELLLHGRRGAKVAARTARRAQRSSARRARAFEREVSRLERKLGKA